MSECDVQSSHDPDYGYFPYQCKTHHYIFPMGVIGGPPCPVSDAPMEEKLKRRKWEAEHGGGGLSWAEKFGIDRKRVEVSP
ncbi:MAG: hypothetical protein KGJ23_08855 [Euryarchaeota archaeon]|nr:hypothetical protein [Euryarchaeota archaeon]MDE1836713.1 hypothetical protein [Euryarchaeota archaeon]MDE1880258.1 hypothetical protein [Euryarchaeota archaeon]MDE2044683.1 hypothetical protein [Thermoplasmata archaeon]